jgi:hypothetical protein
VNLGMLATIFGVAGKTPNAVPYAVGPYITWAASTLPAEKLQRFKHKPAFIFDGSRSHPIETHLRQHLLRPLLLTSRGSSAVLVQIVSYSSPSQFESLASGQYRGEFTRAA